MIQLGRQEIAEIFFSLIILLIVDKNLGRVQKSILAIIFLTSLVVSHYGLAYISIGIFGSAWLLIFLSKVRVFRNWYETLTGKLPFNSNNSVPNISKQSFQSSLSSGYLLLYFIVFTLVWYNTIALGTIFNSIVSIGTSLYSKLSDLALVHAREPLISTAFGLDWGQASTLGKLFRVTQYGIEVSLVISLLNIIFNYRVFKIKFEYRVLALASGLMLLACIIIPGFSSYLNATRFFQIGLILLSPLCISGMEDFFKIIIRGFKFISPKVGRYLVKPAFLYLCIMIILIPYYLFNTGFVFEITKSNYTEGQLPSSMALSNYRVDFPDYNLNDALGAEWLVQYSNNQIRIYNDEYGQLILDDYLYNQVDILPDDLNQMSTMNYIYLRPWNLEKNERVLADLTEVSFSNTSKLAELTKTDNLVYNNGFNQILAPSPQR